MGLTSAAPRYLSWKLQWWHLQQNHKSESCDRGDMTRLSSHLPLQNNAQRFLAIPLAKSAVECRKQNVSVTSLLLCYCKRMTEIDSEGRKKKKLKAWKSKIFSVYLVFFLTWLWKPSSLHPFWSEHTCISITIHVHVAWDRLAKHLQARIYSAPRQFLQQMIPALR